MARTRFGETVRHQQFGEDGEQLLNCLAQLGSLRQPTILVGDEADPMTLGRVGELAQLDRLRWFGGHVDGSMLRRLATNNRLSRLGFYNLGGDCR